ncbi:hypothetical protein QBC38DRAFT_521378 [Podospora fimiseda]|uniref:Uncharacterized protein n=1 Tax=Podospora fimiseda TaxID=252190 RepID=A0AAN7BGK0_9PEZI|nr:hypothetical protein QBC38DRAFT_521378 [Podospora fimiseda]
MARSYLTTKLPVELVDMIINNFCPLCSDMEHTQDAWKHLGIRKHSPAYFQEARLRKLALYSLCLTCSHLNQFATPHLYHDILPHYGTNWFLLTRTLIGRPDLASHVKRLVGDTSAVCARTIASLRDYFFYHGPKGSEEDPDWDSWGDEIILDNGHQSPWMRGIFMKYPREIISYANSTMRRVLREAQPKIRWKREFHDLVYLYTQSLSDILRTMPYTGLSILISLCPNLEQLSVPQHRGSFTQIMSHSELFELGTLPNLKTLVLQGRGTPSSDRDCYVFMRPPALYGVFRAAPNLEVVACPSIHVQGIRNRARSDRELDLNIPTMNKLKALYFTQCYHFHADTEYVTALLKACPNLEALFYAQWNRATLPSSIKIEPLKMGEAIKSGGTQQMDIFIQDLASGLCVESRDTPAWEIRLKNLTSAIEERWSDFCSVSVPPFPRDSDSENLDFGKEALEFGGFVQTARNRK